MNGYDCDAGGGCEGTRDAIRAVMVLVVRVMY